MAKSAAQVRTVAKVPTLVNSTGGGVGDGNSLGPLAAPERTWSRKVVGGSTSVGGGAVPQSPTCTWRSYLISTFPSRPLGLVSLGR